MSTATVTTNGRITIPKDVRGRLRLRPGDEVRFLVEDATSATMSRDTISIRELKGILPRPSSPKTLEDMEQGIAEGAAAGLRRARR